MSMHGVSTEKVAGGKLLRVKVDFTDTIKRVQITGDFFLHPEDGVELIEAALAGVDAAENEENISDAIRGVIEENNLELIGVDAAAIARNVKAAMREVE